MFEMTYLVSFFGLGVGGGREALVRLVRLAAQDFGALSMLRMEGKHNKWQASKA